MGLRYSGFCIFLFLERGIVVLKGRGNMGKIDIETKNYMSANARFADIFNYCLYGGKQVLKAENLIEKDPIELLLPEDTERDTQLQKKERDLLKAAVVRESEGIYYMLLGLENQSFIDYGMPVRGMVYESMRYGKQIQEARQNQKEECKKRGVKMSSDEFLSGIKKGHKILPVITLALYWGRKAWDGPMSLYEMLDVKEEILWQYISDYKLNLILPQKIEDFSAFRTDLKQVLEAIKVSNDKQKIKELFESDEAFKSLNKEAAMIIRDYIGLEYEFDEKEENWNMCKGLEDLRNDSVAEGRAEALNDIVCNMYEQGLAIEEIARYTKLELEEVKRILGVE